MKSNDRPRNPPTDLREQHAAHLRRLGELHVAEQLERISSLIDVSRTARQVMGTDAAEHLLDQASGIVAELLGRDAPARGTS